MWAILSNPQVVLHLSHNLPAEWNCSCISKCFYSIIHIKELSVIVKMPKKKGNETIFSSQEATQLIFRDSDSEGNEVNLGENYCEDSDKESDWEPNQEDLDTQSEQEDEDFNSLRPSKNKN